MNAAELLEALQVLAKEDPTAPLSDDEGNTLTRLERGGTLVFYRNED